MITTELARILNWHKRMISGARGTTSLYFRNLLHPVNGATNAEIMALASLRNRSLKIGELLEQQLAEIDTFYLAYGSERAKKRIAQRIAIEHKIKTNIADVTQEEWNAVYPPARKNKK